MFRLVESIRLENGVWHYLPYHQQRMDQAVQLLTGKQNRINLLLALKNISIPATGLYKCRVLYTTRGEWEHELHPYKVRAVNSVKLVYADRIHYSCKYEDRSELDRLFLERGQADDILIIKNGLVTDASYSNVLFYDGVRWITPSTPLLPGVMRAVLLHAGKIHTEEIPVSRINRFKKIKLINALLGFQGPEFPVSHILF